MKEAQFPDITKGALAGAVGGLVGAFAMSGFAYLRRRAFRKGNGASRPELAHLEAGRYVSGSRLELDSIELAADRIDKMTGHKMSPRQKSLTAAGVHLGVGVLLGAVYGTVAEFEQFITRGYGAGFAVIEAGGGNLAWTAATRTIKQYSIADHLDSIADHAVFGVTLETTRRLLRGSTNGS